MTLDEKELFADPTRGGPRRSFLVADLEVDGKNASRNLDFFEVSHNLELPVSPKVENHLTKTADGYALTLQSPVLARSVQISFGDLDVQVSDNYFDLLPKESVTVTGKTSIPLDQLQAAAEAGFAHGGLCRAGGQLLRKDSFLARWVSQVTTLKIVRVQ